MVEAEVPKARQTGAESCGQRVNFPGIWCSFFRVARGRGLPLRTIQRWASQYRREGLAGLARKGRSDRGKRHLSDTLRQAIEGRALEKPPLPAAAIHRKAVSVAEPLGEAPPTYRIVCAVINDLDHALVTLAHEGTKAYTEAFDLIHRHEASGPNAVWQADHTELDIWLKDGRGHPEKPWLTIILDDYSRAVAGYALSFSDPSAIQTALALRQAIWRKGRPGWQICGIPGILYSDHGSNFTSRHLEQVAADLKIRLQERWLFGGFLPRMPESIYSVRTAEHLGQRIALDMQREQQCADRAQTTKAPHQTRSGTDELQE